jgi:hypothetical protein
LTFHSVVESSLQFRLDSGGALFWAGWMSCGDAFRQQVGSDVTRSEVETYIWAIATAAAKMAAW